MVKNNNQKKMWLNVEKVLPPRVINRIKKYKIPTKIWGGLNYVQIKQVELDLILDIKEYESLSGKVCLFNIEGLKREFLLNQNDIDTYVIMED